MENFKITNKANKEGRIEIISEIGWWRTNGENFTRACKELKNEGVEDIEVYLNTPGGSVLDALEIINQIKQFKGKKTAVLGAICASAGTLIACEMDTVKAAKNCQYMIHDIMMQVYIQHLQDFESNKSFYKNLQNTALDTYERKTKIAREKLEEMLLKTTWMSAKEAKKQGFVDEIIEQEDNVPENCADVFAKFNITNIPTTLNLTTKPIQKMNIEILKALELQDNASVEEVVNTIKALKNLAIHASALLCVHAEAKGLKKETVLKIAKADFNAALELVNDTVAPIVAPTTPSVENTTRIADLLATIQAQNQNQTPDVRKGWSFSDYSKNAPSDLKAMAKNDKANFVALFKAEFGIEPTENDISELLK